MKRQYLQKNSDNQRAEGQIDEVTICEHRQHKEHKAGRDPLRGADEGVSVWTFSFSDFWGRFT